MAINALFKRKYPLIYSLTDLRPDSIARKRVKNYNAYTLAMQSTNAAFSTTSELDVVAYIEAYEYKI